MNDSSLRNQSGGSVILEAGQQSGSGESSLIFKTFSPDTDPGTLRTSTERLKIDKDGTMTATLAGNMVSNVTGNINFSGGAASNFTTTTGDLTLSAAGSVLINTTANNSDITLTPHGNGNVNLNTDTLVVGDSGAAATIKSNGAGTLTVTTGGASDLILSTNGGTDSGNITITDGVNGDITITANGNGTVQINGNLSVTGTTSTVSSTNTVIQDHLLELNTGATSNANDSGIIIERGTTGDNAFIGWDESANKFILGTTTAEANSTGDLTIANADLQIKGIDSGSDALTIASTSGDANINIIPNGSGTLTLGAVGNTSATLDANAITLTSANALTLTDGNASLVLNGSGATSLSGGTTLDLQSTGNVTIDSSGGTIGIGTDGDTGNINIGTNANARTIQVGNAASSAVNIDALAINLTSVNAMNLSSGGQLDIDTVGTDAINIGKEAAAKTITIGNNASTKVDLKALAVDLTSVNAMMLSSGGQLDIDTVGTDASNIGTEAAAKTITIGNDLSH